MEKTVVDHLLMRKRDTMNLLKDEITVLESILYYKDNCILGIYLSTKSLERGVVTWDDFYL